MSDLENRVENIEKEFGKVQKDVAVIKDNITNHIPHLIAENKTLIEDYGARLEPLERKSLKVQGASDLLSIVLKGMAVFAGVIWTVIKIIEYFTTG